MARRPPLSSRFRISGLAMASGSGRVLSRLDHRWVRAAGRPAVLSQRTSAIPVRLLSSLAESGFYQPELDPGRGFQTGNCLGRDPHAGPEHLGQIVF